MNRKETQGVLALLRAAYPNFYKGQTKEDLLAVVNLWQIQFADFACEDVIRAVHALIATRTEGFPPTIGAVKEQAAKLTEKSSLSEAEAWAMVSRAARNGLYRCREEYDKLPPAVQKAVGDAEQLRTWAAMDEETVASVVASNFARSYRTVLAREKEALLLPQKSKDALPGGITETVLPT